MIISDKIVEQERYNSSSKKKQTEVEQDSLQKLGPDNFKDYLKPPYLFYHELIMDLASKRENLKHLDLCCGDGIHSLTSAQLGAKVIALDYAENSILLAKKRAKSHNVEIDFRTGDVESLPFEDSSFDLVTCAGSLSYIDHDLFLSEVYRVLKNGGAFICVDSLNHNFVYRVNRFIHYLRGQRTFSTLKGMPDSKLLNKIKSKYQGFDIRYFGIFVFTSPVLKIFMSEKQINKLHN
jgi:ubiquinone/menaquinone biosynthesis C-methylase UbiE